MVVAIALVLLLVCGVCLFCEQQGRLAEAQATGRAYEEALEQTRHLEDLAAWQEFQAARKTVDECIQDPDPVKRRQALERFLTQLRIELRLKQPCFPPRRRTRT
jgi:hypothetical protein